MRFDLDVKALVAVGSLPHGGLSPLFKHEALIMTPVELRQQGLEALVGYVGMVRFLQQFDAGSGDYAKERHQWQNELTVADIMALIKERHKQT
jgi:hypothetical protein